MGGPGVVVYARAVGWGHRGFAATAQLQFVVLSIASLAAKGSLPTLPGAGWAGLALALVAGLAVGTRLSEHLDPERGMRIVTVLALVGALLALGRGIVTAAG